MTPAEYKNGKTWLLITTFRNPFGDIIVWLLPKESAIWPHTNETAFLDENTTTQFLQITDSLQQAALLILIKRLSTTQIKLHLKGTDFQQSVGNVA
jgi:hypothetical protein